MEAYRMIDVHCHLDDFSFETDLEDVIRDAKARGVEKFVISALVDVGVERAFEITSRHPCAKLSVGAQPQSVSDGNYRDLLVKIEETLKRNGVVALGEVGLDRGREGGDITLQKKFFRECVRLADSNRLPLVVHSRGAGREAIELLLDERPNVPIDMHAFDGRASAAFEASKKGIMFSIPPSLIRSEQKRALVKRLPLTSLMLESDAPALGPEPDRRNVPSNLIITLKTIAHEKKLSAQEVADSTYKNSVSFFLGRL
ncbi:MAG TPA: TatD family deoxyribonuclease [Thermoprotei archaeon]|nr:TatD family deoxyribonuclease [Thermoprotei archaeon]